MQEEPTPQLGVPRRVRINSNSTAISVATSIGL